MNISKYIQVDEALRFRKRHLYKLKKNRPAKSLFILCTPNRPGELFEIIESQFINEKYKDSYVLAISYDKGWIVDQVVQLVDQLYNKQQFTYEDLKKE